RHVRRGRPRRYPGPAPRARRAARRRGGSVQRRVSALLRPRPRGHSHRAGRANRLTPQNALGRHSRTLIWSAEARGRSVWTPRATPEPGLRIAFVADLDGNLVELLSSDEEAPPT